jgi:AsmA protein
MAGVSINPLLKDTVEKDIIEGTIKADASITMTGQDAEKIKQSLNGRGDLSITDGAIKGIDLASMVRNVKTAFGLEQKGGARPRTDFSELAIPFTLTDGVFNTPGTSLMSPLVRVVGKGDADLVKETLDFQVQPKVVATIKGQGDTMERSGIMVPVLVSGTFSDPKFRPDLKGLITQDLGKKLPGVKDLNQILPAKDKPEEAIKPLEDTGKKLLKGLFK